jgi:hypothetical protein
VVDRRAPLNARQVDVLRWIADGCAPGVMEGHSYKTTAVALQDRRLVLVSRKGGVWSATATEAGRYYAEHGRHPPELAARAAAGVASAESPETPPTEDELPAAATPRADALRLLGELRQADGTVRIESPDEPTRAAYRRAIHAAKQYKLVPEGFHLLHTGRTSGDLVIRLSDDRNPDETGWNRIRLNARRVTTDPALVFDALEKDPEGLHVTADSRPRAIKLIRQLAEQVQQRGHKLGVSTKTKHPKLFLLIGEMRRSVELHEEYDEKPHVPTPEETRQLRRKPWLPLPRMDRVATGRLRLQIERTDWGKTDNWSDEKRRPLEKQLPTIIREIERHAVEDEQAWLESQRRHREQLAAWKCQEEEERRQWEAAMAAAVPMALEAHRRSAFRQAYDSWTAANKIRSFCDALDQAASATTESAAARRLVEWSAWGRHAVEQIDPVGNPGRLAETPFSVEPTRGDLAPFVGDWSTDEPGRGYRSSETQQRLAEKRRRSETWYRV